MAPSRKLPDAEAQEDDQLQYGHGLSDDEEAQNKYSLMYPHRPINHSKTLPFHELFTSLFNPLNDNKKRPTGPTVARAKQGPHGQSTQSPHEMRRNIIQRFISRWRSEVGDDIYPAFRLILPEKDRDRPVYGLKEKAIGKLLVKLLKINPNSDDGYSLLNWKLPGQTTASRMAGDFGGRCYEVLSKRAMRNTVGNMRIAEVNRLLDKLTVVSKEEDQLPIFETFYNRMNADELMWLIRIILRQMKVGASEKTILDVWHPDGEALFNVTSSLRRVCWELTDPNKRLKNEETGATLMQCFQPQLAQFQMHSFQKMIDKMGCTEDDPDFWIEEKLDGERMQLHMTEDSSVKGGRKFQFWSRKGKDYTYLYGDGFEDDNSALTRHIKDAFDPGVENIILDGEMITWDPEMDVMVGFGVLKSAALSEQRDPFQGTGHRPLFRVFDCLYLNGLNITQYTLRDRRNALNRAVKDVFRRIEVHQYQPAQQANQIDTALRKVVAEASEGLVLKNPRSVYRLNSRNDDWMKVKPEYMEEFGESLDCVVIGGYYGSGHRGGRLSSFLCGLRVNKNDIKSGANPMKCISFFKVGGGFRAEDYGKIKHHTDGKWIDWDRKHPPIEFIELGGGDKQYERPDVWIKPCDSVVLEVKAASVGASDSFGTRFTLRFPRFKKLREDKTWDMALDMDEFIELKARVEAESKEKEFKVDTKRRITKKLKKELVIAGNDGKLDLQYAGSKTEVFEGLSFCVLSEMLHPQKKSKGEVERIIKSNGGSIFQSPNPKEGIICIGDKKVVKVASLMKSGHTLIVKPCWILDALKQAEIDGPERERFLIPFEPRHMFFITDEERAAIDSNVDEYGDSYARDVSVDDLRKLMDDMIHPKNHAFSPDEFLSELEDRGRGLGEVSSSTFRRCVAFFVQGGAADRYPQTKVDIQIARGRFLFAGGKIAGSDDDEKITHYILADETPEVVKALRKKLSRRLAKKIPRVVGLKWVSDCWDEKTLLDEDQYAVMV